ncbi:MAG: DUF5686 family protein [Bacteroidales bacterium]
MKSKQLNRKYKIKNNMPLIVPRASLFFWLFFGTIALQAQQTGKTFIKGVVVDAKIGNPVPFAVVVLDGTTEGTVTDSEGRFSFTTDKNNLILKASCLSYKSEIINLTKGFTIPLVIKLTATSISLDEIVIKADKVRYRNKNNPAVSLIEKVIANKAKNRSENLDFLQYEKYDKTQFALTNIEGLKESRLLGKFKFVFDNIDTTKQPGKEVLPLYIKETITDVFYRKLPKAGREIVKADKMVSFEGYLDNQGITRYLKYLYQDIDIYDNNILFLSNQFLSPVAASAPSFYRYFIIDTIQVNNIECVKMFFAPRNKTDMLFQGFMYITLDGNYAVKKIEMELNRQINLNWVKDAKIVQEFEHFPQQGWAISNDELSMDLGVTAKGLGIFGQRSVSYKKHQINIPIADSVFNVLVEEPELDSVKRSDEFWEQNRHAELSRSEKGIYTTIDSLKKVRAFMRTMDIFRIAIASFHDFGPFEIGPVITFYSYNPIEGSKLRLGGRTTPKFSKKINFEGYLAYGIKDKKFKYNLGANYSFTSKPYNEFPAKSLRINYQEDTKVPGQELYFVQEGNAMLSLKRGVDDKLFYNKTFKAEYLHEFKNHFSYSFGFDYTRQAPGGTLNFNTENYLSTVNSIPYLNTSEVSLNLRYAPHEQFYQGKLYRAPIASKYPVIQLKYTYGSKMLGSDYNYHNLRFSFYKRFYPTIIGYTTVMWEAGKTFGQVPYPLLEMHNANQTYLYQSTAYNLMNFLEFVSDQYTSINIDHCFNGFIFNKIPLLKKLSLREIITVKLLYGSLSKSNNPDFEPDLFKFPTDRDGNPTTFTLGKSPYTEVSVGVSNIFKFMRVDLVRRLTYLDHPNVSRTGIRIRFKFDL